LATFIYGAQKQPIKAICARLSIPVPQHHRRKSFFQSTNGVASIPMAVKVFIARRATALFVDAEKCCSQMINNAVPRR
jgi:hypothetical protein